MLSLRRTLAGLGALALVGACKSSAPTSEQGTPEPAAQEGSAAAEPAVDNAAAEPAENVLADFDPTVPVSFGAITCEFVTGSLRPEDVEQPRLQALMVDDGQVFAQINANVDGRSVGFIQRFDMDLSDGCKLTQDMTFGDEGRLHDVATAWGSALVGDFIVAEAGNPRLWTRDGAPVEGPCAIKTGSISVDAEGNAIAGVTDFQSFTVSDAGCEGGEVSHAPGERLWEPSLLDGDLVGTVRGEAGTPALVRVKPDGSLAWRHEALGEGDAARTFANIQASAAVGGRVVVGPGRPGALTVVSADGDLLGVHDLMARDALPGLSRPTLQHLATVNGRQFLAGGVAGGASGMQTFLALVTLDPAE